MKTTIACLALLTLAACRSPRALSPATSRADLLATHLADARNAPTSPPGKDAELQEFEQSLLKLRAEWDQRLAAPGGLAPIRDFATDAMRALRAQARAPEFAASLATTLDEERLLAGVFERNPAIRAARLKLRGTIEQYAQVTYLDTILSQYAAFQRSSDTRIRPALPGDRPERHFPFPGTLELKAALVNHAVEEARARYAGVLRDAVVEARQAYARYRYLGAAVGVLESMLAYLRQLEDGVRGRFEAGTGSKGAVLQVQVEIAAHENERETRLRERATAGAQLNTLLDLPLDTPLAEGTAPTLPVLPGDLAALLETAAEAQPDLVAARATAKRMETMIELAESTAYPALSPNLSAMPGPSHETGGSDREKEPFTTRPKVKPDPWFGSKEAYLREAREALKAAQARVQAVSRRTQFAVKATHVELETAHRLLALYRDVQLAQAEQAWRDASSRYAADRGDLLTVIDTLRQWLRFQLEAEGALRDVHAAHARLEGAVGRALPAGG